MKTLCYASVLLGLLWPQWLRAQISTDTCCAPKARPAIPERASTRGLFRFTSSLGAAAQYRTDVSDNKAFPSVGALGTLAADYYFRQRFGVGVQVGYLGYSIEPAYTQFFERAKVLDNATFGPTEQLQLNNAASFHVLAGPALSLRLFHRLTLTTALRGGLFYTDTPTGSVYETSSQRLRYRLTTDGQRWRPGGLASLALYFPLATDLHLGLGAAAFASPVTYTVDNLQGRAYTFSRVLGGYSAFASLSFVVRTRPLREQLPVVLPSCYAPVLASDEPVVFNVARAEPAVFKWKSGAPIYAADEEFTFRLYALPSNTLVKEQTTTEPQLVVPTTADLRKGTTQLYFTLQASRRDQAGQRCLSPVVTGNVSLVRK